MKLTIFIISIITAGTLYFTNTNDLQKIDKQLFSSIINTSLKDLSPIFKQDVKSMINKLTLKNITVLNKQQTIVQVALYNAKESSEIINILTK